MAIRFSSFEYFKTKLASADGTNSSPSIFLAGLLAGTTESIMVVTPVITINLDGRDQN
jgi:solute carrier family 25 citrate transporter 1